MSLIRWFIVILLPLVFLIGVACGGDDEEATAVPEEAPTAAPAAGAAATTAPAAGAAATTVPAAAPTTAAAAAAPTAAAQPTAAPVTAPAGAEPVASRLRIAFRVPVDQVVVPYKAFITSPLMRPTYDQLIWNNRFDNSQEPMLATEWSMSPDALNWTFKLREGVPFHDAPGFEGGEFTAKDVVRSYDLMFAEGHRPSNIPAWKERLGGSENIEVVSDYEVVFRLNEPWPTLNYGADEEHQNTMGIYSADYWDNFGQETYEAHPVGTGPWKFVEIRTNEYILWERFKEPGDDHWWQIPEFSEMQVFFVPEHATRLGHAERGGGPHGRAADPADRRGGAVRLRGQPEHPPRHLLLRGIQRPEPLPVAAERAPAGARAGRVLLAGGPAGQAGSPGGPEHRHQPGTAEGHLLPGAGGL